MSLTVVLLIICLTRALAQDECTTYVTIPNAEQRYYNYRVNDVIVYDFYLKPGWYRAGDEIMPTEKPKSLYICGTQFPIWMNGTHPTAHDGIVDRVACTVTAQSFCSKKYNMKVKNCGTFSVYFLNNTATRQEAYCFGIGTGGEVPKFTPHKPVVTPIEVVKKGEVETYTRVHFSCTFEPSTNLSEAGLHYQVLWYATKDGLDVTHVMSEQPKDNLNDLQLTEEIFMNNMKQTLGVNISCAVLPLSGKRGTTGTLSNRSEPFFAGIYVSVTRSKITRGDNGQSGKASVTSTIPIGCEGGKGCTLAILAYVPDEDKCNGPSFGDYCGTSIVSNRWNNSYDINIVAGNDDAYTLTGVFDIHLRTESSNSPRIWDNYSLPKFSVEIVDSASKDWQGKICYSLNDPHLKTFDGRKFENQNDGEFILYRHLNFSAEVQIKTRLCGGTWSSTVRCNCGVAVKAGMDVFVLDVCDEHPFIGYKDGLCVDSTLDVRKTGDTYKIYFPYGTYTTVSVWSADPRYLNVFVTSSIHDQEMKSTGLCGAISATCVDDFRNRDGTYTQMENVVCESNPSLEPSAVINEWRVWKNESLFTLPRDVKDILKPWITFVCACDKNSGSTVDKNIPCGGHTTKTCRLGAVVGTKTCHILNQRKRRSILYSERFPSQQQRSRRSVSNQLPEYINMTEERAQNYCQKYMKQSPVFDLCKNVPSTRPESNINTCVMDILLTKTTVWSDSARESMREQCLNEISRNNTFREVEKASGIVEEIKKKACPSLCSNRGRCVNGTCSCDSGYGSSDCSLDLSEPPEMFGLLDHGLCDERHVECNQAFVYGKIFAEGENLTCRIKPFINSLDGSRKYDTTFYVPAEHETLFEVICPVQQTRRKKRSLPINTQARDRFVLGYTISVSNDGQRYGRDIDLYMYNSECQLVRNDSNKFTFSLMDGYCFIDQTCVGNGQFHQTDVCMICDDKQYKFDWSHRDSHEACSNKPTTFAQNGSSQSIAINIALILWSALISGRNLIYTS